ncbi:MAG: type II toxin-antitoxin system RelE/ParE family toxin [Candidatus Binatia bacterium]
MRVRAADPGGGLKKRIRLAGRGKRGGARVIVARRQSNRWFFVFGFARNDRESIDHDDRRRLVTLARRLNGFRMRNLRRPCGAMLSRRSGAAMKRQPQCPVYCSGVWKRIGNGGIQ